jgi:hypothetical protein
MKIVSCYFSSSSPDKKRNPASPAFLLYHLNLNGRQITLREPEGCAMMLGKLIKAIRESKPRDLGYRKGRKKHMTQDELHDRLINVYLANDLPIPAFSISALERGLVRVDKLIIECVAAALNANDFERAYLLEAGGYCGIAELLASARGELTVHFAARLDEIAEGEIKNADLAELNRLISTAMEIEHLPAHMSDPLTPDSPGTR